MQPDVCFKEINLCLRHRLQEGDEYLFVLAAHFADGPGADSVTALKSRRLSRDCGNLIRDNATRRCRVVAETLASALGEVSLLVTHGMVVVENLANEIGMRGQLL